MRRIDDPHIRPKCLLSGDSVFRASRQSRALIFIVIGPRVTQERPSANRTRTALDDRHGGFAQRDIETALGLHLPSWNSSKPTPAGSAA